ncbi:MAG: MFS transporter [Streptosporangiaceae bacterium]
MAARTSGASRSGSRPTARTDPEDGAATLIVASAATLLVLMNYTAPLVTLPETAAGVHAGVTAQTWILSSISLGLSALLLAAGSLADDRGRRRVFVAGLVVLAGASVTCALATDALVFIAARIVQGGASAALLAASLGLVGHAYPTGPGRVRATGVWGAMIGAGIALGPILTAALTESVSWRAPYWVFAGGAVLLTAVAPYALRESRAARPRRLDLPGVVTLGTGLTCLLAAVTEGRAGWLRPEVAALFAAAAVALAAFVAVEARGREPMLDLELFRRPAFVAATTAALFTGLSIIGLMSYLPTVLQHALGQTPLATAGVFSIWSGTSFAVALQARRLASRVRGRHQLALGLLLCAVGELTMLGFVGAGTWQRMIPGLVIAGVGSGALNSGLARLAVGSVPADRGGMGSGANNTARYIGSSLGVAVMVATVAAAGPGNGQGHGLDGGTDAALLVAAALAVLGAVAVLLARDRRR